MSTEITINQDIVEINVTEEVITIEAPSGAYPLPSLVNSVFGRVGNVVAQEGDYTLTQLGGVTITTPSNGQVLKYNGTQWVNGTDTDTGLTSVGLSMPSAFSVANSPLTANGTLSVTGAGTTAQYVRGDGTLATFPVIAQEAQRLITEVYNSTGATLAKGSIVYINGGQGNLPTVTKAIATGDATSAQTYGVVQSDITNMNNGFVVAMGSLTNLDTQIYPVGTQLYLSGTTAGAWTSTKPYAPIHLVYVGIVVRSHPTQGIVEIRIQNGYELDELHDVSAQSPTNGDILQYVAATDLWTKTAGTTTNIAEGTNLYFTDARARAAISLTTTGTSGASTYNNTTGVLNIPQYQGVLTNPVTGTGTTNTLPKFTGASTIGNSNISDSGTLINLGSDTNINGLTSGTINKVLPAGNTFGSIPNGGTINLTGSANGWNVISRQTWNINDDAFTTNGFTVNDTRIIINRSSTSGLGYTAFQGLIRNDGTATQNSQYGIFIANTAGNGNFSSVVGYKVGSTGPSSNTGTYTNYWAFQSQFLPQNIANFYGIEVNDYTATTISRALNLNLSAGTGKFNIYAGGTAANYLAGDTGIGTATLGTATKLTIGGTETAVSAISRGQLINTTLVASANGDTTIGLDINPTYNNGAFGVSNYGIRVIPRGAAQIALGSTSQAGFIQFARGTDGSFQASIGYSSATTLSDFVIRSGGGSGTLGFENNAGRVGQFFSTGNFLIQQAGTYADAGFRLDVNGTTRLNGSTTITGSTTATSAIARGANITSTLVASANNDVLVGLDINPTFSNGAFTGLQNLGLRVEGQSRFNGILRVTAPAGSQDAYYANDKVDIYGANDYNLRANNGSLALSTITTGIILFRTNNTERMRIANNGNVLIGTTTDAGFRLDVNGTARVQGAATFSSTVQSTRFYNTFASGNNGSRNSFQSYNLNETSLSTGWIAADFGDTGFTSARVVMGSGYNNKAILGAHNGTLSAWDDLYINPAGGNVLIGRTTAISSAKLSVDSTTQGFLPPRMTTTQKNAIGTPAAGIMVYDTTLNQMSYYNGTTWINF